MSAIGLSSEGEQWHCPNDDAWTAADTWRIEIEDEPGHRLSWHHCPRGHGFPGRTPYSFPDVRTKARAANGTPIAPPVRGASNIDELDEANLWEQASLEYRLLEPDHLEDHMSTRGLTPEQVARRCLDAQGSYDKARAMARLVWRGEDPQEVIDILDQWQEQSHS